MVKDSFGYGYSFGKGWELGIRKGNTNGECYFDRNYKKNINHLEF